MLIAKRVYGLRSLQVAGGIAAAVGLYWIWLWGFAALLHDGHVNWDRYEVYCLIMVLALIIDFFRLSRWVPPKGDGTSDLLHAFWMSVKQVLTILALIVVFLFLSKDLTISRLFLLTFLPALLGMLVALNRSLPRWLANHFFRGRHGQRTLVVGTRDSVRRLCPWIERKKSYGILPVGAILEDGEASEIICGVPCLGNYNSMREVIRRERASFLIHASLPRQQRDLDEIRAACDSVGTRLTLACDLGTEMSARAQFFSDDGVHLVSLRNEPLESPFNRLAKRTLDVAVALIAIIFVLPFTSLLVWLIQRRSSPGSLFFRQVRSGQNNEAFTIYKYRTMREDNPNPNQQATRDDPRIFCGGNWLRRTSIDELPQFINVLFGEMSVVGPRPHVPAHDEHFSEQEPRYRVRQLVKPGITGLAQVRGLRGETRTEKDVSSRTDSDLHYLENWTFGLDILIILRTMVHVFRAPVTAA